MEAYLQSLEAENLRMNLLLRQAFAGLTVEEKYRYAHACTKWEPDRDYLHGQTLWYEADGYLYETQQNVRSTLVYPPGSPGTDSLYAKVPEPGGSDDILPWVYGEKVEAGDRRMYEGTVYERVMAWSPGTNIWEPPTVPAVWRPVESA